MLDGYELYLSGHSWYDGYDLWLLDDEWAPKHNYIALGSDTLKFERHRIVERYEKVVEGEIRKAKRRYKNLIVVVGLSDGDPKRLK